VTHLNRVAGPSCLIDLRQEWVLLGELEVEDDLRGAPRGASRVCASQRRSASSCRHYLALVYKTEKEGETANKAALRFFTLVPRPG
jgi:hypothetical protein